MLSPGRLEEAVCHALFGPKFPEAGHRLSALEGSARLKGESAETLTVTTGDGAENIDLDSAFGFYMDVSYEASQPRPYATIRQDAPQRRTLAVAPSPGQASLVWIWLPILAVPIVGPALVGWKIWDEVRRTISEDPLVWEKQIRAFEKKERRRPTAKGAVVFAGSSTIRFWSTLARDMAPLPAVQRGFGGAKVNDVIHYMDRLITSHDPAMVVLYIGANDMLGFGGNRPKSVTQMQQLYDTLLTRLHDRLPRARIVVLATFPSPLNARRAREIEAVNEYLRETVENKPWLDLLDGNEALKTASGDPDRSLFRFDRVHLNKEGYARWAQILRPKLLAHWREKLN